MKSIVKALKATLGTQIKYLVSTLRHVTVNFSGAYLNNRHIYVEADFSLKVTYCCCVSRQHYRKRGSGDSSLEFPVAGMWIPTGVCWPEWNENSMEPEWARIGGWNECEPGNFSILD